MAAETKVSATVLPPIVHFPKSSPTKLFVTRNLSATRASVPDPFVWPMASSHVSVPKGLRIRLRKPASYAVKNRVMANLAYHLSSLMFNLWMSLICFPSLVLLVIITKDTVMYSKSAEKSTPRDLWPLYANCFLVKKASLIWSDSWWGTGTRWYSLSSVSSSWWPSSSRCAVKRRLWSDRGVKGGDIVININKEWRA